MALILVTNQGFRSCIKLAKQSRDLQKELSELAEKTAEYHGALGALKSDQELEAHARKALGYVKPGEVEYLFPPPHRPVRRRMPAAAGWLLGATAAAGLILWRLFARQGPA